MFYLDATLKPYFVVNSSLFDQMMALKGVVFREQKGRMTSRVQLGDHSYFIKQHFGVGWKEICKNLLQLRWPVLSAKNEWQAIKRLQVLDVPVPDVKGVGEKGKNIAKLQSFILLQNLNNTISLETLCASWNKDQSNVKFKRALINEMARMARIMHANGINHRDFYLCHFLLDLASPKIQPKLYLIDLHRAMIHKKLPMRWRIKDLAGLYFSSIGLGFTKRDYYRFVTAYSEQSMKDVLKDKKTFWNKVKNRGDNLYRKHT